MKNLQSKIKILFFAVAVSIAFGLNVPAQEKFVSSYDVSFQIPKNSSKTNDSTATNVSFEESSDTGASFQFGVLEGFDFQEVQTFMNTENGKRELVAAFLEGMKEGGDGVEPKILEKKDAKIAGFKGYQLTVSLDSQGYKFRSTTFFVPVPEQKRMYSFNVLALDSDYDRWYKIVEPSINSFAVIKAKK